MVKVTYLKDRLTNEEYPVSKGELKSTLVNGDYYLLEKDLPQFVVSNNCEIDPVASGDDLIRIYLTAKKLNLPLWELTNDGIYRQVRLGLPLKFKLLSWWFNHRESGLYWKSITKWVVISLSLGCTAGYLYLSAVVIPYKAIANICLYIAVFIGIFPFPLFTAQLVHGLLSGKTYNLSEPDKTYKRVKNSH